MSLFRPGPVPNGVEVRKVAWPAFGGTNHQVAAATQTAVSKGNNVTPLHIVHGGDQELNDARLEAARILQEAAEEASRAYVAAQEEGFEFGRQEGVAAGKAELDQMRQQVQLELENARLQAEVLRQQAESNATVLRLEAEKEAQAIIAAAKEEARRLLDDSRFEVQRRLDESQQALADLAVAAAMRLVQGHLALQPQSIIQMVSVGLRRLKDTNCTVRVNPQDLPLLEAQRSLLERELGAGLLQVSTDPGLQRGSYMINSPQGQVDGTLEHQAERIQAALNAALGGK